MDTTKIIKGVVGGGRYTVTAPIIKEDYGLYLQIEGVELPPTYQVDFSNSEHNGTLLDNHARRNLRIDGERRHLRM